MLPDVTHVGRVSMLPDVTHVGGWGGQLPFSNVTHVGCAQPALGPRESPFRSPKSRDSSIFFFLTI